MSKSQSHYFITKPMHPSQKVLREEEGWIYLSIDVAWNFELEREIISLGERAEVISPRRLRRKIRKRLEEALELYQT